MQSPLDRAREFYHQGETERALKELLPLAKKGDVDAQYLAGEIYCVSDAPAEKAEEYKRAGISWLKSASGQNCDKSMVALARYYEKGEVLEQNIETVGLLLQKAAALGNLEAARRWGRARLFGNFEDALGQISRGPEMLVHRDFVEAIQFLWRAVDIVCSPQTHSDLDDGIEEVLNDLLLIGSLYQASSADHNFITFSQWSDFYRSIKFDTIEDVEIQNTKLNLVIPDNGRLRGALLYLSKTQFISATFVLGDFYQDQKIWQRAFDCYEKAAGHGIVIAMFRCGYFLKEGKGTVQNYAAAYAWYNIAAARGDRFSLEARNELTDLMTKEQVAEGQKLSIQLQHVMAPR